MAVSSSQVREEQKSNKSMAETAQELWELVKSYARQETIDPLKGVARYVAFGTIGSIVLGLGLVLLTLAGLRALQTETGTTFTGNWSWAPYLIVLVVVAVLIGLTVSQINRKGTGVERRHGDRRN